MASREFLLGSDDLEDPELEGSERRQGGKDLHRAERKLASATRQVRRMRRDLPRAFRTGGKTREDLVRRILDTKARVARLREDLERRRTAAA